MFLLWFRQHVLPNIEHNFFFRCSPCIVVVFSCFSEHNLLSFLLDMMIENPIFIIYNDSTQNRFASKGLLFSDDQRTNVSSSWEAIRWLVTYWQSLGLFPPSEWCFIIQTWYILYCFANSCAVWDIRYCHNFGPLHQG